MRHSFPKILVPEGQKCIEQTCLRCTQRSVVYRSGTRLYLNENGIIVTHASSTCGEQKQVHSFPKVILPEGAKEIIQQCLVCNKKRVVYASGSTAYFDEVTGARIPYVTACSNEAAVVHISKAVSIPRFVISEQNIDLRARFIECMVMLQAAYQEGMTEKIKNMIGGFLQSQDYKKIAGVLEEEKKRLHNADALTG